ncbi:hypothetical protein CEXT_673111 [Caerostris extrusa]|uniref:Uncharacterized protein n=1 Tax=Caerostris extrusa TaxID=172846 RepID=A0AAV4VY88_CAEEX|nr:hypothetical protein CEXT_673111 [Caerostris extrusa]
MRSSKIRGEVLASFRGHSRKCKEQCRGYANRDMMDSFMHRRNSGNVPSKYLDKDSISTSDPAISKKRSQIIETLTKRSQLLTNLENMLIRAAIEQPLPRKGQDSMSIMGACIDYSVTEALKIWPLNVRNITAADQMTAGESEVIEVHIQWHLIPSSKF